MQSARMTRNAILFDIVKKQTEQISLFFTISYAVFLLLSGLLHV